MAEAAKLTPTIAARRQDLVLGTIRSIAKLGYQNSTVQSICEEAGLSRGLVGHYYRGKDDLLLEALRFLTDQLGHQTRNAIREVGRDPFERLLAVASVSFREPMSLRDQAPVWLAFWGVARWEPEMLALHRKLWRGYRSWIERLVRQAAEERNLDIDARRAAITFTQLIDGLWIGWIMDEEAYGPAEAEAILRGWVLDLFGESGRAASAAATLSTSSRTRGNGRISK